MCGPPPEPDIFSPQKKRRVCSCTCLLGTDTCPIQATELSVIITLNDHWKYCDACIKCMMRDVQSYAQENASL